MDIQKEVDTILYKLEQNEELTIKLEIEQIISNIKKQKNVKLFYKLLINKLEKKIITTASLIANSNSQEELKAEAIFLKKYLNVTQYLKEEYELFKKQYVEEKIIEIPKNKNDFLKYDKQNFDVLKLENEEQIIKSEEENDVIDFVNTYIEMIKNLNILENPENFIEESRNLYNEIYGYLCETKSLFPEFTYLIDILSNKYRCCEKNSTERKILKPIIKKFTEIHRVFSTKENPTNENPYFDVINFWFTNDDNYLYIKELIKRKPEVCSMHNNGKHIAVHILEQYIENFKKMIIDKNNDYINKNYLKEIYYLITKNSHLRISDEEKNQIDTMIKDFSIFIKEFIIKERRKNAALLELKTMKTSHYYKKYISYDFNKYSIDNLTYEKNRVYDGNVSRIKNEPYVEAFLIGDKAYNITKQQGEISLKMYTFNISGYISERSIMYNYLEQCEFKKEQIDDFVANTFKFKLDNIYPTICYNLKFYESGRLKGLAVTKENIKITNQDKTFDQNGEMKEFYDLYKKSIIKNGGISTNYNLSIVNEHFENLLNDEFVEFIKTNKLPFIYYGYSLPNVRKVNYNMNALSSILYNIDKTIAYEIINITSSKIDKEHYSLFPIEDAHYDLRLVDSFNLIGIINQKMLNDIYFDGYCFSSERRKEKEKRIRLMDYYKIVSELNSYINYVDVSEIKESKGKIKRKFKI